MSIKALSDRVVIVPQEDGTVGIDIDESKIVHQRLGGVGKNNHATIDDHVSSNLNPHSVQAKQTGAVMGSDKNKPNGVVGLDKKGKISEDVIPANIARYADLSAHRNAQNNPHNITPEQIQAVPVSSAGSPDGVATLDGKGRVPKRQLPEGLMWQGSLDDHNSRMSNPHKVTAVQTGAVPSYEKGRPGGVVPLGHDGKVSDGFIPGSVAKESELKNHMNDCGNPHKLTAVSVGAVPITRVGKPDGVAQLDSKGRLEDSVVPLTVVREESLKKHENDSNNPHRVTPEQINALHVRVLGAPKGAAALDACGELAPNHIPRYLVTKTELDTHASDGVNPHGVTPEQIGALPYNKLGVARGAAPLDSRGVIPNEFLSSAVLLKDDLSVHTTDKENPHKVTALQVGAVPVGDVGSPRGVASLDRYGNVREGQLPPTVVRKEQLDAHFNSDNPHHVDYKHVGNDVARWNANRFNGLLLPEGKPEDGHIFRWSEERGAFVFDKESMVGEVNYVKTDGYGESLYLGKQDSCLWFKSVAAGSNKVNVHTDENTLFIDVGVSNISHNDIADSGSRKHVEIDSHLGSTSNPHRVTPNQVGNSVAQWNANKLLDREISTQRPSDGQVLKWNARAGKWVPSNEAAIDAESNDAKNVGSRGVGIFKRKQDAVLEFNKLLSVSNKLSIKKDEKNSVILFSVNEETFLHDKLSGSGEHSHRQLDEHVSGRANPHNVTPKQVGCDRPEWNANKLNGVYVDTSDLKDGDILIFSAKEGKLIPVNLFDLLNELK